MSLFLDSLGHLYPYEKITSSVAETSDLFVAPYPNSTTRKVIFDVYLAYIREFRRTITTEFTHWLDGSFMSPKLNPKDLDCVVFLDYRIFEQKEDAIFNALWKYRDMELDAFISPIYPIGHSLRANTEEKLDYWTRLFSSSRPDPITKMEVPKGFIEIIFK